MTTVINLTPGDAVPMPLGGEATFIAQTAHPIWPYLQLVVWRMPEGHAGGDWSHDALSPVQDVGEALPATTVQRQDRLRIALLGGTPS